MSTAQRATYRVLAVDDEEKIRDAYRLTLCPPDDLEERSVELAELESKLFETTAAKTKKPGFDVELCSQGVDAIQAVREGLDAGAPFAVAFIDVRMPPGIDGIETAIRIREIDPNINIVIVTGYSDHHPAQIADRVPPADKLLYYQKPLQAVELEQLARALAGRWHADREIASAAGRLNHLLTSSPIVIYSREAEEPRAITYISENVVTQLGHPTGDFLADSSFWARHIHPSDQPDVLARSQACSDDFHSIQYRFLDSNGAYRWLRDEFALIRDKADKVVEIVGSWTDITNQKAIESQLIQARKMEAVGQLTGGIAHDFNNMLAAILGNLEMLGDHLEGNAKARRSLDIASRAASRAAELTHRLLAFSRQQHLEPQAMDLGKVLSGMRGLLQTTLTEAVEMDMQVSGDLRPVLADPAQLESTILNLAINARDAMPEGGRLVIESTNTDLDEAYAAEHAEVVPGSYVMLAVSDNGLGMPSDVKERVFEPFFTTKDVGEGTGLGLSTIYGFIKQLGGHVTLYSEEGHGTCVKLYLPVAAGPETVSLGVLRVQGRLSGRRGNRPRGRGRRRRVRDCPGAPGTPGLSGAVGRERAGGTETSGRAWGCRSAVHRRGHARGHERPRPCPRSIGPDPESQGALYLGLFRKGTC